MKSSNDKESSASHPETLLTTLGRDPHNFHGFVNPPVVHASTVLYADADTFFSKNQTYSYARRGTPTSDALEQALTVLEGAAGTVLTPSGLSACSTAILSVVSAGDHLLVVDTIYQPTRHFCETVLKRMGVETTYYDPALGEDIASLFKPNTKAIFTEAPGSQTFEMQDIKAVTRAARNHDIFVLMDNTWATPLFFQPIKHGVDLSIQAGTKYIVGHSDVMLGTIAASERAWPLLQETHGNMGLCAGPDDIYLALRGLRTMGTRLKQHQTNALEMARWLEGHAEVARVLHPGLESNPGHELWKRDFTGASGLFGIILQPGSINAVKAFLDALTLYGMGYSWGGFESLAIYANPSSYRTATKWEAEGPLIRLHIGLEHFDDLKADLENGLKAYAAAR
ncbi:cystathionine beta-lyase [Coralliovum pocilloporae]|uniref:cystathionine beta-lyase n=1 Tax=Coralliovum pocilloporae TaxID=3066369 RepID=UPI00330768BA